MALTSKLNLDHIPVIISIEATLTPRPREGGWVAQVETAGTEGRNKTPKIIKLSHQVCDDLIQRGKEPILELRRDSKLWDSPDLAELKNKYKLQKVQPPAKGGPASSFLTSDWRVAQALAKVPKVKFRTVAAAPATGAASCEVAPDQRGKCRGYDLSLIHI